MRGVVVLIYFLIVSPALAGYMVCHLAIPDGKETAAYRFVTGFLFMTGLWELMGMAYMFFFSRVPFHTLILCYGTLMTIIDIAGAVVFIRKKARSPLRIKKPWRTSDITTVFCIIIFLLIALLQLFNTAFRAPVGHIVDDVFYYDYINDIVYTDRVYLKNHSGNVFMGDLYGYIWRVGFRMVVSQWYTFLAFLSVVSGIHPLIICRTIMPVYLIILIYLVVYIFATYTCNGEKRKSAIFMMSSAVILEAFSYTYYLFYLVIYISTWGKIVAGIVGIPMLLYSYVRCACEWEDQTWRDTQSDSDLHCGNGHKKSAKRCVAGNMALIIAISIGVSSFSFATVFAGGVGLLVMMIVFRIKMRSLRPAIYAMAGMLPFLLQIAVFMAE